MDEVYFRAAKSNGLLLSTLVALAILLIFAVFGVVLLTGGNMTGIVLILIPLCIIFFTIPFSIKGYRISENDIRIIRVGKEKVFPIKGLKSVEIDPNAMNGSLRLFGVSGFFSNIGLFINRRLGKYHAYTTDQKMSVVLRFKNKIIVVTPCNPQKFYDLLKSRPPDAELS